MGRITKSTELLKIEKGKLYAEQAEREKVEPRPEKTMIPSCPQRFSKEEKKVWRGIKKILENYGLFHAANAILLELLTTAWVQYVECSKKMDVSQNIIIKGPQGGPMYNPYFNAQHKLGQLINKYSADLGLCSSGLARIGALFVKGKKQKDEMGALLD